MAKKAIVLLSGGVDSTTTLYWALKKGFECFPLIFSYGQRHHRETEAAIKIAQLTKCEYVLLKFILPWRGSTLLEKEKPLPLNRNLSQPGIPSTYVPGRNIIFLSFGLSYAEVKEASHLLIGANVIDYSGYPDCRAEFYNAFEKAASLGTKRGVQGQRIKILAPLIKKSKSEIIKLGLKLKVPFELTWSCYKGGKKPCQRCDSCYFRAKGFKEAGVPDPLITS